MAVMSRALVAPHRGGPLEFQTVQLDDLRSDETMVEIHAVGICHADVACLMGKMPAQYPCVFGHEGAGIVQCIGSDVRDVMVGDHVALSYNFCGECDMCGQGYPAYCEHLFKLYFGGTRLDGSCTMRTNQGTPLYGNFFGQSSFSHLAVVNQRCIVKVEPNALLHLYAPFGCSMQTGAGAVMNVLNVPEGAMVAVFGTGSVGMAAVMACRLRKASIVIGIDISDARLEIAKKLGATHVLNSSTQHTEQEIQRICQGQGFKYAVDTTGVAAVIETMIGSLSNMGHAVTVGAPAPGTTVKIDVINHLTRGRKYTGCNQGDSLASQMVPYLIEQHASGKFPVEEIIKTYEIEDFAIAIEDMRTGKTIKPVLVWKPSEQR